jgi:hypothetical protein
MAPDTVATVRHQYEMAAAIVSDITRDNRDEEITRPYYLDKLHQRRW